MNWATVAPTSGSLAWSENTPLVHHPRLRAPRPPGPPSRARPAVRPTTWPDPASRRAGKSKSVSLMPRRVASPWGTTLPEVGQDVVERSSFVVVANRLPVDSVVTETGQQQWRRSPGGLVTALHPVLVARRGTWVGWAGGTGPAPEPFELDGVRLHPVQIGRAHV